MWNLDARSESTTSGEGGSDRGGGPLPLIFVSIHFKGVGRGVLPAKIESEGVRKTLVAEYLKALEKIGILEEIKK
jgi:hypothetical protein